MTNASMTSKVGRFMNEASLKHCIAAATTKVSGEVLRKALQGLTINIAILGLCFNAPSYPLSAILVIDTIL